MSTHEEDREEWVNGYVDLDSENITNLKSQSLNLEEQNVFSGKVDITTNLAQKITQVETILGSIRNKADSIKQQTEDLEKFNKKLSILLECFDAYSYDEIANNKRVADPIAKSIERKEKIIKIDDSDELNTKKPKVIDSTTRDYNQVDNETIITELFKNDSVCRSIAADTYKMILEREKVPLDDIVKSFKYSKYKVIEILNILIKNKIVLKSFEKGFVYRINK